MSDKDEIIISEYCEKPPIPIAPKPKRITKKEDYDISSNSEWDTQEQLDETALKLSKNENNMQTILPPLKPERQYAVIYDDNDDIITPKKQIYNNRLDDVEYIKTVSCL
jgi:exonuclease VII large subunit